MARIVSRILELDELVPPPPPLVVPPPPRVPAPLLVALHSVPFGVWIGLLSLGLRLNAPLTAFIIVALSVWKGLSAFVVSAPTARARATWQRARHWGWDRIRPDLAFDEAGRIGLQGEIAALRVLTRLPDDCVILHDLRVPTDFNDTQLDLVVLAPSGIWCLEVKAWAGRVYGQEHERTWTQVKLYRNETVKDQRENPVQQNDYHCRALSAFLTKLGYEGPVQSLVVFTEAELMTRTDSLVIRLPNLLSWVTTPTGERPLTPQTINDLAQVLRPLIRDPQRQSFTSASATARHHAQVARTPTPMSTATVVPHVRPTDPSPRPERSSQPLARLAAVAGKTSALILLFVLATVGVAAFSAITKGLFAPTAHGARPIAPVQLHDVFPTALYVWGLLILKVFVPEKRWRRRR